VHNGNVVECLVMVLFRPLCTRIQYFAPLLCLPVSHCVYTSIRWNSCHPTTTRFSVVIRPELLLRLRKWLPDKYSPNNMGMLIPNTDDGRVIFLLPWEGSTIAGTTVRALCVSIFTSVVRWLLCFREFCQGCAYVLVLNSSSCWKEVEGKRFCVVS